MPLTKPKTVAAEAPKPPAFDHSLAQTKLMLGILDEQKKAAQQIVDAVAKAGVRSKRMTVTVLEWQMIDNVKRIKTLRIESE
ncbi:MAG: hypothetical protein ING61_05780 [Rhodocyclaceae bacterium]|nr:hypothetical protein [Rhodocyclaceae bacterium]